MKALKITRQDKGKFIKLKSDFIVYKAVSGGIAQLLLPKGTTISVPRNYNYSGAFYSRKLRADQAVVLMITPIEVQYEKNKFRSTKVYADIAGSKDTYLSIWARAFKYKVGKLVKPANGFYKYNNKPCKSGIHFYTSLKDAELHAGFKG